MKYAPSESELKQLSNMSDEERFNYCLAHMAETEEVWGLAEPQGWVIGEKDAQSTLPIWPYKEFAVQCKSAQWAAAEPQAISLEQFVYKVSQMLIENQMMMEVFPTITAAGKIMEPKAFFKILENIMESGEYFMEG